MIRTIPLDKLVPSPRNVRRTEDAAADRQLQADIEARGLMQNLVVTAQRRPRGSFAVEAGARRLRALKGLAEAGRIPADHEVTCLVLDDVGAAHEASLAENFQRLAMNPADECIAFRELIAQGADVDSIAKRFGLTARFVEGRLRLAALAPVVFEALGAGEITLDAAKAYATTSDRERQAHVFEQMSRAYGAAHPDSIRRMMTQATVGANDRRALFVGEEAYLAAGGRIERDLFEEESGARWLDIALVERLALEKLEAIAAETAAEHGLAFVRPTLDGWIGHDHCEGLRRLPATPAPLSDDERARIEMLEAEMETLAASLEQEETDAEDSQAAEARYRELAAEIDSIMSKPPVIDAAMMGKAGAFLLLDPKGQPHLGPDLYVEIGAHEALAPASGEAEDEFASPAAPAKAAGLSQRLADELAMQRRDILAVHVAADPAFALDLAIFLMIDRESGHFGEKSGAVLSAPAPSDPVASFTTPDAPATRAKAEAAAALDVGWTAAPTRAGRFDAFRSLGEAARGAWLGHAVARTLEASLGLAGERACAFHDHLAGLLGIEVERWWRPTGANFFDRVPKAVALAALEAVGGPALASRYASAKKAELAQACERIFAGDFIGEVEVKQAALAWVPEPMRFAPPSGEDAPGAEGSDPPADEIGEAA